MARIFICYRRHDSQGYAGRIHEVLARKFGSRHVQIDVADLIPDGESFPDTIVRAIQESDVLLAIVGRRWLASTAEEALPTDPSDTALAQPNDWVAKELKTARSEKVLIIPVFVGGVAALTKDVLPRSWRWFADLQGRRLQNDRWKDDVTKLVRQIRAAPQRHIPRGQIRARWAAVALAALIGLGVVVTQGFGPLARYVVGFSFATSGWMVPRGAKLAASRRFHVGLPVSIAAPGVLGVRLAAMAVGATVVVGAIMGHRARGAFPEVSKRAAWQLCRIHSGYPRRISDVDAGELGARLLLTNAGLRPTEPKGEDFVSAELKDEYWVTAWWGTYEQLRKYGVRYGRATVDYFGNNDTYFEVPPDSTDTRRCPGGLAYPTVPIALR